LIVGYARVSTTERGLGLRHDELNPAFDASVDPTKARWPDLARWQFVAATRRRSNFSW
jgi:hypothetical protein